MFTPERQAAFFDRGFVSLPGLLDAEELQVMRQAIWRLLARQGVEAHVPSTWPEHVSGLRAVRRHDRNPQDLKPLVTALDTLFGVKGWKTRSDWGQALVTFPRSGSWTVPHRVWHLDHPYRSEGGLSGANVFLLLDDVEAGGGGTAVVDGSPALVEQFVRNLPKASGMKHKELNRRLLASDPWLRGLKDPALTADQRRQRFMLDTHVVHEAQVRVVELIGRAGDVIVCHPWLIHAPAPNVSERVRLMRVIRVHPVSHQPDG